jgi:hypothetical protein
MNTNESNANANATVNPSEDVNLDLDNKDTDLDNKGKDNADPNKDNNRRSDESDEDRLARYERQADRLRKKLGKDDDSNERKPSKKDSKSEDHSNNKPDLAEKAYMRTMGLDTVEKQELARQAMLDTGKDLDAIMASKWFQEDLAALATKAAIPTNKGRTGNPSATDTVDYWIKKGELPPNTPENSQLRRDVVNAKVKAETSGSPFSSTPVVR